VAAVKIHSAVHSFLEVAASPFMSVYVPIVHALRIDETKVVYVVNM